MSQERLQTFFPRVEGRWRVAKQLREMVVFAHHSLIKDPPFSKVNLISCRNLLIYLEPALQKKVMTLFHYALNPGGFLFLGTSEGADEVPHLFSPVNRRWKLFQRAANGSGLRSSFVAPALPWVSASSHSGSSATAKPRSPSQPCVSAPRVVSADTLRSRAPSGPSARR